ncbi:methylated-DNA--[protein]-cysteine S-methyltransferase [Alginatibacterium sediminis]|uniref:Methylated-DNA--[protein]-cysteine S-methyltransferase n=1 Tax=Alginatibacterium sediminis TaxID=2164068 RepID=A0A420E6K1_9ALTE|nr:methylated-DNA--[protein]-cysteine S-methyltransferase [Alginatibacterium sediminis]RKF13326.1 methylated-DNA--[protein]-cysteine S-methyltransferase [Alginatibacterium sediminis]
MTNDRITFKERIYSVVGSIPKGKVLTYKAVAQLAGNSTAARAVGTCLGQIPHDSKLPWHRVINSQGKISFELGSDRFVAQKQRLQDEGVMFVGQRCNLKQYLWDL